MSIRINGKEFYRTAEACHMAGTSKNTFLRWVRDGTFTDVELRDRRGWRLFSDDDLNRLKAEVNQLIRTNKVANGV
jgi:predicted site-specific integrase-resolvase